MASTANPQGADELPWASELLPPLRGAVCPLGAAADTATEQDFPLCVGEEQQAAFETLKAALSSAPVLRSPDHDKPFVIHSDASELAVGAVLQQDFGDGLQPIAYHSRTYTPAEQNYPTREKEMLAIIEAAKQWRHLSWGKSAVCIRIITPSDTTPPRKVPSPCG